ncbi:MAG: hypothetical protein Q8P90_02585 [bacterium]|nr:hypothetical protein [bacterium]
MFRKLLYKIKQNEHGLTGIEALIALGTIALITPLVVGGVTAASDSIDYNEAVKNQISVEDKGKLQEQLSGMLSRYPAGTYCFGRVSSIGDRNKYMTAFNETPVVIDPEKTKGALAAYQAGVIYVSAPADELVSKAGSNFPVTLWHELAHHMEVQNGDRRSIRALFGGESWTARNERHTEYMEAMLPVLERLKIFERAVENKKSVEVLRQMWQSIEKAYREGSFNSFESLPSDLSSFQSYTGFGIDLNRIRSFYENDSCISIPNGVFSDEIAEVASGVEPVVPEEEYVIWISTNTNAGLAITTKTRFETDELASNYSGGGIDPEKIMKHDLFVEQSFPSFEAANKYMCDNLTDVRQWPLAGGLHGYYGAEPYRLANFGCD